MATTAECRTCRFWRQLDPKMGECRAAPPQLWVRVGAGQSLNRSKSAWPLVQFDEWCGAHQPKNVGPMLEPDQRLVFVVGAQSGAVEPLGGAGATSAAQSAGSPSAARSVAPRGMTGNGMESV